MIDARRGASHAESSGIARLAWTVGRPASASTARKPKTAAVNAVNAR